MQRHPSPPRFHPLRLKRIWRAVFLTVAFSCLQQLSAQLTDRTFSDLASDAAAARTGGDLSSAVSLYQQAVQLRPEWAEGWWYLGVLEYSANSYQTARDALTRYIALVPSAGPALALRGLCEFETQDFTSSLNDIQQGLQHGAANRSKNEQILRFHEAQLLTRKGDFEGALRSYTLVVRSGSNSPEMLTGLGLAGLRVPLLTNEVPPEQRAIYIAAGSSALAYLTGNQTEARKQFQTLFARFPATANAHSFYGYLLFSTEIYSAVEQFQDELQTSPGNGFANSMLAWALLLLNRPAEALAPAERAYAEQPNASLPSLVLGRSQSETGNLAEGIKHLQRALSLDPDNLEIHIALARAYGNSGRREDARRERLVCLQLTKEQPEIAQP